MNSEIKKNDKFQYEINISADEKEFNEAFDKIIKREAGMLSVPGFRKGKVPPHLIRKMYGDLLKKDFLEDILNILFVREAELKKLIVLKTAEISDVKFGEKNYVDFIVKYESMEPPENLLYKDFEFHSIKYNIGEKVVNKNIDDVRLEFALEEEAEEINGKLFNVDLEVIRTDDSGNIIGEQKPEKMSVNLSKQINPKFYDALQNKKLNEEFEYIDIHTHEHSHEENEKEIHEHKDYYKIKITGIKKLVLPEFNDELSEKASKGKIKTAEEYISSLKTNLARNYESLSDVMLENNIVNELIIKNDFDIPESLIDRYFENYLENEKRTGKKYDFENKEFLAKLKEEKRENLIYSAKWSLIKEKIIELENIALDDNDYIDESNRISETTGIPAEKALQFIKKSYDRNNQLLEKKLFKFLKENSKIIEKEVNLDDEENNE